MNAGRRSLFGLLAVVFGLLPAVKAKQWKVDSYVSVGRYSSFPGPPTTLCSGDGGQAAASTMTSPNGVWMRNFGGSQQLYVADGGNERVRIVDTASGIVSSLAAITGQGMKTWNMCGDTVGNVYVLDFSSPKMRKVTTDGVMTNYAGTGSTGTGGDGGQATSATFSKQYGCTFDVNGDMLVADAGAYSVRKIVTSTGIVDIFAGNRGATNFGQSGQKTSVSVKYVTSMFIDTLGDLYFSEGTTGVVRKVASGSDQLVTYSGVSNYDGALDYPTGNGGAATSATFTAINCISFDLSGNLYIASGVNYVRMIEKSNMVVSMIAGGGNGYSGDAGPALSALFASIYFLVADGNNVYVSDMATHTVRILSPLTEAPSLAPTAASSTVPSVALSSSPSAAPTEAPTAMPSLAPSLMPTAVPSFAPSGPPSVMPTLTPSEVPTLMPSDAPSIAPTLAPTGSPSLMPTAAPTVAPTLAPSASPSLMPTLAPSVMPSFAPTAAPSTAPSQVPSVGPSFAPTAGPSFAPTAVPSVAPSAVPTHAPSLSPTVAPSVSVAPSATPTASPTVIPSVVPSFAPTAIPTVSPTAAPSVTPSLVPSAAPSTAPTVTPSAEPTVMPTISPTLRPSVMPTQTRKPTSAAFTIKPSPQVTAPPTASFDGIAVDQPVAIKLVRKRSTTDERRLAVDILDGSSRNALIATTARILGLTMSAVSVVNEYLIEETSAGIFTVGVVLRILARDSDFPQQTFSSRAQLFAQVSSVLADSFSTGHFDTVIAAAAIEFQAAELIDSQYDFTVVVPQPTFTEVDTYDPMDAGLSTGEYAGIVIGVLVAFIVFGAIVFLLFKRRDEESAQPAAPTSQV